MSSDAQALQQHVVFVSAGYAFCSATLIIINKWALLAYPFGATLTAMQFGFSAAAAFVLGVTGVVEVDPLEQGKVWAFLPAVVLFYISIASNLKLLQASNVDTFIVVRAITPIITNKFEQAYLGTPPPSWKAFMALLGIMLGAVMYAFAEREHIITAAVLYAVIYVCAMTVDSVIIKKVVTEVPLTRWGMVYYNNLLAFCMFPAGLLGTGEYKALLPGARSLEGGGGARGPIDSLSQPGVLLPVLCSCGMGLAISYFALNCRKALSATSFTVLAVTNKFATVAINTLVWSHHASGVGIACLLVCISMGVVYSNALKEQQDSGPDTKQPPLPLSGPGSQQKLAPVQHNGEAATASSYGKMANGAA